jgi:hypothetical protein
LDHRPHSLTNGRIAILERELAEHKAHVAREYVTQNALEDVTQAINCLADRLDTLFLHFEPPPN